MSVPLSRLWRSDRAAAGAEFALVAPLMVALILGMVDVGRFMWEVNKAEKATQLGARFAIVTDPVSTGLVEADFVTSGPGGTKAGDLIPASTIGALTCTSTTCTCTACSVTVGSAVNSTAFNAIVTRMKWVDPNITASNVRVTYRGSGFGFAGDAAVGGGVPETMEISPLVTVSLTGMTFQPATSFLLASINLPAASTTLPAEDAAGSFSN